MAKKKEETTEDVSTPETVVESPVVEVVPEVIVPVVEVIPETVVEIVPEVASVVEPVVEVISAVEVVPVVNRSSGNQY